MATNKKKFVASVITIYIQCCAFFVSISGEHIIRSNDIRKHYLNDNHGRYNLDESIEAGSNELRTKISGNLSFIQDIKARCPDFCEDVLQNKTKEGGARDIYWCQLGCSKGIEEFYSKVRELFGAPDPPTLIPNSLQSTSLQLSWEPFPATLPYLVYTVQRRYYRSKHQWQPIVIEMGSSAPLNATSLRILSLKPYKEYQFRVGWVIAKDLEPIYSKESNPIKTLAKGVPSPPENTNIQPISNTSVSVTWNPPSQPNGRLLAFILKLKRLSDGHTITKEIPISQNVRTYTFYGLHPYTKYTLSISAQNSEGMGEKAEMSFNTPQSTLSNDISSQPSARLLLQGIRDVYLQQLDPLLQPDTLIYRSQTDIAAIASHFKYKWVFVATKDGDIIRTGLEHRNETLVILSHDKSNLTTVAFLSIDWLYNKLYIVGQKLNQWCILQCGLDGNDCWVVYHLYTKPVDFAADPYTGYLYLVMKRENRANGGLFKLDLMAGLSRNHFFRGRLQPLVKSSNLGPFTVDHAKYRILVINETRNTVLSVTLDGHVTDIRENTQSPKFTDAKSIDFYSGIFYWTTGSDVVIEEYNPMQDNYYQNSFAIPNFYRPCKKLIVVHDSLQPVPIPIAPPQNVQVVYGQTRTRITWGPPPRIPDIGEGAWCEWKYIIRLNWQNITNITENEYIVENLSPNFFYNITVQAYAGQNMYGPVSSPVRVRTLRKGKSPISFYWVASDGIYESNVIGEDFRMLVDTTNIWSLTWFDQSIIYANNLGRVFVYESEASRVATNSELSPRVTKIQEIRYAKALAYDYIGRKLYWSDPKSQSIWRCSLETVSGRDTRCRNKEKLHLVTIAWDFAIDSYKGLLLWTTGQSLEIARLNGYSSNTLFQNRITAPSILKITIDPTQSKIYWIRWTKDGGIVQRLSYNFKSTRDPITIHSFEHLELTGPVSYFNERLICLEDTSSALITDLVTKRKTHLNLKGLKNVTDLNVKDPDAERFPRGLNKLTVNVAPVPVPRWSINIKGNWDDFTLSWAPSNNTNYGVVLYEVILNNTLSKVTTRSNLTISTSKDFRPFTPINVSITAMTYWASAKTSFVTLKTPSAKPSAPINPRLYLGKIHPFNGTTTVTFRWGFPLQRNGKILGYLVHCWRKESEVPCICDVEIDKRECKLTMDLRNRFDEFAVNAYTDAGAGRLSERVNVQIENLMQMPKLLVTGDNLEILDIDVNNFQLIPTGYFKVVTAAYFAYDNIIFWINENNGVMNLMAYNSRLKNVSRLLTLNKIVPSLLKIDFIGRKICWVAEVINTDSDSSFKHGIVCIDLIDLNKKDNLKQLKWVVTSQSPIQGLAINPYLSKLYWTSSTRNGMTSFYSAHINGSSVRQLFSKDHFNCNCSSLNSLGESITYDPFHRNLVFYDKQSIWRSSENGCSCTHIMNITSQVMTPDGDLREPYSMAVDEKRIYWAARYLYASEGHGITKLTSSKKIYEVSSIALPPYPPSDCLIPTSMNPPKPILLDRSSHYLKLRLPVPVINCSERVAYHEISLPTNDYKIYFGVAASNGLSKCDKSSLQYCSIVSSQSNEVAITNLGAYKFYKVFITVTNFYRERRNNGAPLISQPVIFKTAAGAPTAPKLIRLEPLTPNRIRVVWGRPEKLNGEKVWYRVHWKSNNTSERTETRGTWAETGYKSNKDMTEFYFVLKDLKPTTNYTVWVVAFSEKGDVFNSSIEAWVKTFASPRDINLVRATPHNMTVQWLAPNDTSILSHQIMYRESGSLQWNLLQLVNFTTPGKPYNTTVKNLKPKTSYGLRIRAWYIGDASKPYDWPSPGEYNMETLADKPSIPGKPVARGIGQSLCEVAWKRADENGGEIELYSLEYRMISNYSYRQNMYMNDPSKKVKRAVTEYDNADGMMNVFIHDWVSVFNGTETYWQVSGLELNSYYVFRVKAKNVYGWSEYSPMSSIVSLAALTLVPSSHNVGVIIGTVLSASILLVLVVFFLMYFYRQKVNEKPVLHSPSSERREVELATLRELPGGSSFIHQSNVLYAAPNNMEIVFGLDLTGLTRVSKSQLQRTKFLGRGAFGEVYEGVMKSSVNEPQTVAIKTLKKAASRIEKLEFIEEARLMIQFKHPNILELLAVCLEEDFFCLVLELMDGGDLLSFLRTSSPALGSTNANSFNLVDLLRMCIDVAKGCVHLEEMHFVHRDLAARNCLICTCNNPDSSYLVVKIGDFGLARDIYRNDYYRKEGEGLLPVRWMSPESLIYGIFTTQSDVWAFGVLLFEIMTLGHQAYVGKSNTEVLQFVTEGGKPEVPSNAPPEMKNLMLQCWEYNVENRPSFKECLSQLENTLHHFESMTENDIREMQSGHSGRFSSNGDSGFSNYTIHACPDSLQLRAHNLLAEPEDEDSISLSSSNFPKYLQVLRDTNSNQFAVPCPSPIPQCFRDDEGYEMPKPKKPPRARKNGMVYGEHRVVPSSTAFVNRSKQYNCPDYRNLLSSSTTGSFDENDEIFEDFSTNESPDNVFTYMNRSPLGPKNHIAPLCVQKGADCSDTGSCFSYVQKSPLKTNACSNHNEFAVNNNDSKLSPLFHEELAVTCNLYHNHLGYNASNPKPINFSDSQSSSNS